MKHACDRSLRSHCPAGRGAEAGSSSPAAGSSRFCRRQCNNQRGTAAARTRRCSSSGSSGSSTCTVSSQQRLLLRPPKQRHAAAMLGRQQSAAGVTAPAAGAGRQQSAAGVTAPAAGATAALPPRVRVRAIIKLGGAAITDKAAYETLRPEVLAAAASHVQQLHASLGGGLGLVCVHGAGSYGHHDAAAAGLAAGGDPADPDKQAGFVRTRRSVGRLNSAVVDALLEAGVPAVSLSPCGLWTTVGGALPPSSAGADAGLAAVTALLAAGLVPVLHGDVTLDSAAGMAVLSGDAIVRHLSAALRPDYVVFLTNVAGVFSADPATPGAELLELIEVRPNGEVRLPGASGGGGDAAARLALGGAPHPHDVTGGMAAKVGEAAAVVAAGGPAVVIAQAGTPAGAAALLQGPAAFEHEPQAGAAAPQLRATVVRAARQHL